MTVVNMNIELQLNGKVILTEQFNSGDRFFRPRFLTRAIIYRFTEDLELLGEIRYLVGRMSTMLTCRDKFTELEVSTSKNKLKLIWNEVK